MWRQIVPAVRMTFLFTVVTGLIYPGLVTGMCQLLFPAQANGSLVLSNGHAVGSTLLGQVFSKPEYFHPRPSAAGSNGYDASSSNASNYGPTNQKLIDRVKADLVKFHQENPSFTGSVPADAVTASASGLDPNISPVYGQAQVARIAAARKIPAETVRQLLLSHTEARDLGFLGEPRVNVLLLNLDLDRASPSR